MRTCTALHGSWLKQLCVCVEALSSQYYVRRVAALIADVRTGCTEEASVMYQTFSTGAHLTDFTGFL